MKKKRVELIQKKEDGYHYREVICPLCDHRFMDETHRQEYRIEGDEREFYRTTCPMCNEELLVTKGKLEAIIMADNPEEKLKMHGLFIS